MFAISVTTLLAFGAAANAVAFPGPQPTQIQQRHLMAGWTPRPTTAPDFVPELFKRQANTALCGYLTGNPKYSITCDKGSCVFATAINWFGCCTDNVLSNCDITTRCIASADASACNKDAKCASDSLAVICTDASAPYCASIYSSVSGKFISNVFCAATAGAIPILAQTTGPALSAGASSIGSASRASGSVSASSAASASIRATSLSVTSGLSRGTTSTSGGGLIIAGSTSSDSRLVPTMTVRLSSTSTGAAAMQTAKAVVGGLAGLAAMLLQA